jgi:hypothetical protein
MCLGRNFINGCCAHCPALPVQISKILLNIKQNMSRNLVNCEHDGAEEVLFGASDGRAPTTTPSYVSSPFDEQVSTFTTGDLVVLFVVEAYRELFPSEDVLLAETAPRRRLQSLDQD